MSLTKKLGFNTIIQLIGRVISIAMAFYIVILLTRYLGLSGYGQYTTIIAYLNFFAVIADFGLYLIAAREMSQAKGKAQQEIFNNSLGFRVASALFLMLLATGISFLMPYDMTVKIGIAIFSLGIFFYLINQVINTIFQVYLKAFWIAIAEVAGRILVLLGIFFVINKGLGLTSVMWVSTFGFILTVMLSLIFGYRYIKISPRIDWRLWKKFFLESWPVGAVIILTTLFFRADAVLLSLIPLKHVIWANAQGLSNLEAVGVYGPPYRIIDGLFLLPGIFLGLVFPQFTKYFISDRERAKRILQKSLNVLLMMAVPLAFGLLASAKLIINVLAGSDFQRSIIILQILGFSLSIFFVSNAFYYTMIGIKEQKRLILPYFGGFLFSVIVNIILISYFSYIGTAITSALTQIVIFILGLTLLKKYLKFSPSFKYLPKIILSGIIMATVVYYLQSKFSSLVGSAFHKEMLLLIGLIIVAAGIYLLILYLLGAIPPEIIDSFKIKKVQKT
jgi:O-antigen/teichoic acid export membrane protein